jgi:hypothetical protein
MRVLRAGVQSRSAVAYRLVSGRCRRRSTAGASTKAAQVASLSGMDAVDFEAAAFGAREQSRLSYSFEAQTGGRATLDTRLR